MIEEMRTPSSLRARLSISPFLHDVDAHTIEGRFHIIDQTGEFFILSLILRTMTSSNAHELRVCLSFCPDNEIPRNPAHCRSILARFKSVADSENMNCAILLTIMLSMTTLHRCRLLRVPSPYSDRWVARAWEQLSAIRILDRAPADEGTLVCSTRFWCCICLHWQHPDSFLSFAFT
jgi:hypothetical protein